MSSYQGISSLWSALDLAVVRIRSSQREISFLIEPGERRSLIAYGDFRFNLVFQNSLKGVAVDENKGHVNLNANDI